jgi:hypothetical protein
MLIGLIVSIVIGLLFVFRSFKLANKNNELIELVNALNLKVDSTSDPVKEDFLKFISDSREWAFEYIEEVQKTILNFKTTVEPHISFFDKFGDVLSNQRPDYEAMKTISAAYKELIAALPGEDNATTKD